MNINIINGIAECMEKEADEIAENEQRVRDALQPHGKVVPEKEQESLNTITTSSRLSVQHLREIAAQLRSINDDEC
jgi:hypothetical protein